MYLIHLRNLSGEKGLKNSGLNGNLNPDLCVAGAMLHHLGYQRSGFESPFRSFLLKQLWNAMIKFHLFIHLVALQHFGSSFIRKWSGVWAKQTLPKTFKFDMFRFSSNQLSNGVLSSSALVWLGLCRHKALLMASAKNFNGSFVR